MKSMLLTLATGVALFLGGQSQVIAQSNFINFDSYPTGALSTGAGSPWNRSGTSVATVVDAGGANALHITDNSGGAVILDTGHSSLESVVFPADDGLNWSFEFQLAQGFENAKTYLRLNTGSAGVGKYIAGIAFINGRFSYLRNPNLASSDDSFFQVPAVSLSHGLWYKVDFEVVYADGAPTPVAYTLSLSTVSEPDVILFSHEQAFSAVNRSADPLRMTISTTSGSEILLRNVTLSAIPEAGSIAMVAGGMVVLLAAGRWAGTKKKATSVLQESLE